MQGRRRRCRGAEAEEGVPVGAGVDEGGDVCGCKGAEAEERMLRGAGCGGGGACRGAAGERVPVGAGGAG